MRESRESRIELFVINKSRDNSMRSCRRQKHMQTSLTIALLLYVSTHTLVKCQDSSFDQDLNQQFPSPASSFLSRQLSSVNNKNNQLSVNGKQQISRLSGLQQQKQPSLVQASSSNAVSVAAAPAQATAAVASPAPAAIPQATYPHRPLLSSRFSAVQSALGASASTFQASLLASPASPPVAGQQQQQQQIRLVSQQATSVSPTSDIEQMMRSAISRGGANEPILRQQQQPAAPIPISSLPAVSAPLTAAQSQPLQQVQQESVSDNKSMASAAAPAGPAALVAATPQPATSNGDSIEPSATNPPNENQDANHETVYSDQRFANLFARRQNLRKSKLIPTEQAKAKPTLPSFIKSRPDPKQFPSAPTVDEERAAASQLQSGTPNAFLSQRVQAANQKALASLQAQASKLKPILGNTSAPSISSKSRPNAKSGSAASNNGKPIKQSASSSDNVSGSSRAKPASGNPTNPFASRSNQHHNSNSSENIIANARKRLLANNALEAAKLKKAEQQQQQ